MTRSYNLLLATVLAVVGGLMALPSLVAADGIPMMRAVDKDEALRGDVVTVTGANLGKAYVSEVYLTNGRDDIKVEIVGQATEAVKIRIANDMAYGRYSLMILTNVEPPMFIEQPVRLSVMEHYTPKPAEPETAPEAPTEPTTTPSR